MSEVDEPQTEQELLLAIHKDVKALVKCQDDHEERIRNLEDGFWKMIGVAGFIGFVSGWFGKTFGGGT
jgi:hypothetical protein